MDVSNDWQEILTKQFEQPYFKELKAFLKQAYEKQIVYPPANQIFRAFQLTAYEHTKVVIVGQDPYHGEGQANGLSFSVNESIKIPPSLRNMFKELVDDIGCEMPKHGDLTAWAKQGVLLLNNVLTVEQGKANSHQKKGWEQFTNAVIEQLVKREKPIVFVLWGKPAQQKYKLIASYPQHLIIENVHPSPLSAYRGFFGSKPYSTINSLLKEIGQTPIDWCLSNQ